MKHNNQITNAHFHKDWQRWIKSWHNQPAAKVRRRNMRKQKAEKAAPRPLNKLRPAVRCPTIKYNTRVRAGRGFTIDELRAANINPNQAQGIGIAIDYRRKHGSEESFQANVQRLKQYKSKLVIFPRRPNNKKQKKGDAGKNVRAAALSGGNIE
eukprot:225862_1